MNKDEMINNYFLNKEFNYNTCTIRISSLKEGMENYYWAYYVVLKSTNVSHNEKLRRQLKKIAKNYFNVELHLMRVFK